MGNPFGVYETNYKVKQVKNLSFGEIWPPSDFLCPKAFLTNPVLKSFKVVFRQFTVF